MTLHIGDPVRVRSCPDVAEPLWDHEGRVLAILPDDQIVVELKQGAEAAFLPNQLWRIGEPVDKVGNPFDLTF